MPEDWEILELGNFEISFAQPECFTNHSGEVNAISQFPNSKIPKFLRGHRNLSHSHMFPNRLKLKNVNKIAVIRASALGDFIVTLPAFEALRAAYPDAEIILLGRPWQKEFLIKGRTPIDRVIVIPVKKGVRVEAEEQEDADELERFFETIQHEQFDLVLNFQGNGNSVNPFMKRLGAKLTVGPVPHNEQIDKPDRFHTFYYYQSESVRYLDTVALAGATPIMLEPALHVLPADLEEVQDLLASLRNTPFVVLHPVALDKRRMWPLEHYPELVNELKERNLTIVFSGSRTDHPVVEEIIAKAGGGAINTCGQFSLGGLAALLSKAALVIGADTGPLHLARAVNTPTAGIYWAPNLVNWGPVTRIIHKPVVSWDLHCPLCGIIPNDPYPFEPREHCDHDVSFVHDVTVEQVLQAADSLIFEPNIKTKSYEQDRQ
jgi:ADP-heptose:LPS heptosyltransferase